MSDQQFFLLINAPAGLSAAEVLLPVLIARWLILLGPVALVGAWLLGGRDLRVELVRVGVSGVLAVALAWAVCWLWPQARPADLGLGSLYLPAEHESGFPSRHVAFFWGMALATLAQARVSPLGFPLLTVGLVVGWSRVYLGANFPLDILAALPVALAAAMLTHGAGGPLLRVTLRLDATLARWRARWGPRERTNGTNGHRMH